MTTKKFEFNVTTTAGTKGILTAEVNLDTESVAIGTSTNGSTAEPTEVELDKFESITIGGDTIKLKARIWNQGEDRKLHGQLVGATLDTGGTSFNEAFGPRVSAAA